MLLLKELDHGLLLGQKSVTNSDIALWSSSNNDRLAIVSVVVDFASGRATEDLKFEFALTIVVVNVKTLLNVDLLLLLLVVGGLDVLLDICVDIEKRSGDDVHNYVRLSDINQHVVFEDNWFFLSDEHSVANTQVFDEVAL